MVTCNSVAALPSCLQALPRASGEIPWELIVVDNASSDDSAAEVSRLCPDATVIVNERNRGFAAACNSGVEKAAGEFLLFLNPDVQMDPGTVENFLEVFETRDDIGLVAGRMRFPDNRFQANCRRFPTAYNLMFSRGSAMLRLFGRWLGHGGEYTLPDYEKTTEIPAAAAAMVMIRKKVFDDIGGFDDRFFMYMEDTDLCRRLHEAGFVNLYAPSVSGVHAFGRGSSAGYVRRRWYHHRSVWKYFLKYSPNGFSVFVLPLILAANLVLVILLSFGEARK